MSPHCKSKNHPPSMSQVKTLSPSTNRPQCPAPAALEQPPAHPQPNPKPTPQCPCCAGPRSPNPKTPPSQGGTVVGCGGGQRLFLRRWWGVGKKREGEVAGGWAVQRRAAVPSPQSAGTATTHPPLPWRWNSRYPQAPPHPRHWNSPQRWSSRYTPTPPRGAAATLTTAGPLTTMTAGRSFSRFGFST